MSSSIAASTKTIADNFEKSGTQAIHAATQAAHEMKRSNTGAIESIQALGHEYQAIMTRNFEWMTHSMQKLAAAKSPRDFMELQRTLLAESLSSAMADGERIFKLTGAVFTASVPPAITEADLGSVTLSPAH